MIDERKERVIVLTMEGEGPTDIAKVTGISRQTVYNWLELEEIKADIDKRRRGIVTQSNAYVVSNVHTYLECIHKLAVNTSDKRTAAQCLMYLVDRSLGKVSTKIEIDSNDTKDIVNVDVLNDEIKEIDKDE